MRMGRRAVCGLALIGLLAGGCGGGGGSHAVTQLSGRVAEIDSASAVVGAQVSIDGSALQSVTSISGAYFFDSVNLGSGWHTVRAQVQIGGQLWTGQRAVLFDPTIPIQNNLLITIAPPSRQGAIRGRITDAVGDFLQNVTVFLNPGTNVAAAYQITDSGGRYAFNNIPAGTYTVVASAQGLTNAATSQVVLTPGAALPVDLSLLVSSGAAIGAPSSLTASAFTYPQNAASTQARLRGMERWLLGVHAAQTARASHRFRIQDWPPGSIIEADLSWSPPSANDLAGYVLERAIGNSVFGTIDSFADPTASAYDDLDPAYTPDQTYQFRINAASTSGIQSSPSNIAAIQPLGPLGGLTPANGASVTGTPTFAWQPVPRAQKYQLLVLSQLPALADFSQMPLVWPPASNLAAGQTTAAQLAYGGPALQTGVAYYWLVFAADQPDFTTARALSASPIQSFVAR